MTRACTLCVCLHHVTCENLRDIMPREVNQTEAARSRSQLGPEGVRYVGAESRAVAACSGGHGERVATGPGRPLCRRRGRGGGVGPGDPLEGPCADAGDGLCSLCLSHVRRASRVRRWSSVSLAAVTPLCVCSDHHVTYLEYTHFCFKKPHCSLYMWLPRGRGAEEGRSGSSDQQMPTMIMRWM